MCGFVGVYIALLMEVLLQVGFEVSEAQVGPSGSLFLSVTI